MNDYKTMRFVDRVGNNYLFRGGAPIANGAFDTDLPTALRNADKSIQLPPQFYLVVICLLHPNADDDPSLIAELNYFKDHKLVGKPISGTRSAPTAAILRPPRTNAVHS
jgi:hypothetical protein